MLPLGDLFIQNIQLKDAGRYVCVAENSLGRDTAQVLLILTGLSKLSTNFVSAVVRVWYQFSLLDIKFGGCLFAEGSPLRVKIKF